jgi:hypothetical protein
MTNTNQRLAEGACCKAAQEWSRQNNKKETTSVDTIYKGMSILTVRTTKQERKMKSLTIYEVTELGGWHAVTRADLTWYDEKGNHKIMPWAEEQSWMEDDETKKRKVDDISEHDDNPVKKSSIRKQRADPAMTRIGKPTVNPAMTRRLTRSDKDDADNKISKMEECWVKFNYPNQTEVLCTEAYYCFKEWWLLGQALGLKPTQCASKQHIQLMEVKLVNGIHVVPSIACKDGTIYYPPIPESWWVMKYRISRRNDKYQFTVTEDGHVAFTSGDVARTYTIMKFLIGKHRSVLDTFFTHLLHHNKKFTFQPTSRTSSKKRMSDPLSMVVFHHGDDHSKLPMAVCLLVTKCQGAFALVNHRGSIIEESTYCFRLNNTNNT